jgi:hypothetical protein
MRWNSEAHVIIGLDSGNSLDFPLNYWFHPWPGTGQSPDNPCASCGKLTSFRFPSGNSGVMVNNFTIALPSTLWVAGISSFSIEFIAGLVPMLNTDEWKLAAVAACLQGSKGGFVSDGFPPTGIVQDFNPSSYNQPVLWQPPSFQSPAISKLQNNCNAMSTNPPPNPNVSYNGVYLP